MKQRPEIIRLAAYNIWNGGAERVDRIAQVIDELDADVVGLCEVSDREVVNELARRGGYDPLIAETPNPRGDYHVTLLSRRPAHRMINLGAIDGRFDRAAMEAIVPLGAGAAPMRVVTLHLKSGLTHTNERIRLDELNAVLAHVERDDAPTVMMGDFNAHAASHPVDPQGPMTEQVRERIVALGLKLPTDVTDRLIAAGWCDAYNASHPDEPIASFSTDAPALRIDYTWLNGAAAAARIDAGVHRSDAARDASDHFPVWVELDLTRLPRGSGEGPP